MSYEDNMRRLGPDALDIVEQRLRVNTAIQDRARVDIFERLSSNLGILEQAEVDPRLGVRRVDGVAISDKHLSDLSGGAIDVEDLELIDVHVTVGAEIQPGAAYYDLEWEGTFAFKGTELEPGQRIEGNVFFQGYEGDDVVEICGDDLFLFEDADLEPDDNYSEE
jgi:hypothetical protein